MLCGRQDVIKGWLFCWMKRPAREGRSNQARKSVKARVGTILQSNGTAVKREMYRRLFKIWINAVGFCTYVASIICLVYKRIIYYFQYWVHFGYILTFLR